MIAVDVTPLVLGPRRGVARALATLLDGWAAEPPGTPIRLFAPAPVPADVPELDGVVVPRRPVQSARAFRKRLPAMLQREGADVLYVPWSAFPRTPVPVVATVHELPFVRLGGIEGRIRTASHRWWLTQNVKRCAALVVPSQAVRDDILTLHPKAQGRVHAIGNGFDPAPWSGAAWAVTRAHWPRVVLVGTGAGQGGAFKKGLDVFLSAIAQADVVGMQTIVVGEIPGVRPEGVEVRLDPDDASLALLLASAHVLVHPARSEGFGYPPLEAMAAGTPVVVSDGGALPEVVGDAGVVVPAGDVAALAHAIRETLRDGKLRLRLIEAGRKRARAYSPVQVARRLTTVLHRAGETR